MSNRKAKFDVSPRIIKILGEELIHDKKIAISELVKNAYDADASLVKITIGNDEIIIEDDGCGMNADIIEQYWLKPGSSGKRDTTERTLIFKRLPLGEKGVGRLGVHRLGERVQVISKAKNNNEVVFRLDWNALEEKANLSDIEPILIEENATPQQFQGDSTGTKLTVQYLKESFNEKDFSMLHSDLLKLLSPFNDNDTQQFRIEFYTATGLFTEQTVVDVKQVIEQALFSFDITFKKQEIEKFMYRCISPNEKMYPLKTIELNDKGVRQTLDNITKKTLKLSNSNDVNYDIDFFIKPQRPKQNYSTDTDHGIDLGSVQFRGYIFEPKLSNLLLNSLSKTTTAYLKENGGIRVYRDGIRVYNYGEGGKDNDILNLDRKRAKRLGDSIGYNQILAAIELDHENSRILREKTNREGFIHNPAFLYLQQQLDLCMEFVTYYRKLDKAEMHLLEGKMYDKGNIDTRIQKIIKLIDTLNITDTEKTKISADLNVFSEEFKQIKDIFLTASNTGLNMTFIIHEVDKIIDHLEEEINNKDLTKVKEVFSYFKEAIASYKDVIRLDKKPSSLKLTAIIHQAIFNAKYRFDGHQIEIREELDPSLSIACKKGLIIGIINNMFDNAIYWLDHYKINQKQIFIKSYSDNLNHHIVIADNGKGFNISFEAALGPFISGRVDDGSMGIGLHLALQVMLAHGGTISHSNYDVEDIPQAFENGAIIKLSFPKELQ